MSGLTKNVRKFKRIGLLWSSDRNIMSILCKLEQAKNQPMNAQHNQPSKDVKSVNSSLKALAHQVWWN